MTITKAIVATFTEQDKEALRSLYKMINNVDCGDVGYCDNCPFEAFCRLIARSVNEEEFIKNIRDQIGGMASLI